jgi:hypothetical protein
MTCEEILNQAMAPLQRQDRVAYRAKPRRFHRSFRLARGLRHHCSAWRAARMMAHGLPGGLPRSPQPLAHGYGWGESPVETRARYGEAPVGGLV